MYTAHAVSFVLCFLLSSFVSEGEAGRLDEIINEAFETFRKSPLSETFRENLRRKRWIEGNATKQTGSDGELYEPHACEHDEWLTRTGQKDRINKIQEMLRQRREKAKLQKEQGQNLTSQTHTKRQAAAKQPLRIFSDTSTVSTTDPFTCQRIGASVQLDDGTNYVCTQNDIVTASKITLLTTVIIPTIAKTFLELLNVDRPNGNLVLSKEYQDNFGDCRLNAPLPSYAFTDGVPNADFYAIWLLRPMTSTTVIANAGACNYDISQSGVQSRPLAGSINFNPSSQIMTDYNPDDPLMLQKAIRVGLHELTHALGFSSTNYEHFLGADGNTYANGPVKSYQVDASTMIFRMVTPTVITQSQAHYGCNSLPGLELENNDPEGPDNPGSHWEKRLVGSEYMSPTVDEQVFISAITLGLYKDMGWYDPNMNFAETFAWGNGEGCSFVLGNCVSNWDSQFTCSLNGKKGCTGDLTARGECVLYRYPQIPPEYQYFPADPQVGGGVWPDYCPTYVAYTTGFCEDPTNLASRLATNPKYNEYYGDGSSCFNIYETASPQSTVNGACYQTKCILKSSVLSLQVKVGSTWYNCPNGEGNINLKVSDGTAIVLTCPNAASICNSAVSTPVSPPSVATPTPIKTTTTPGPRPAPVPTPVIFSDSSNLSNLFLTYVLWSLCCLLYGANF